MNNEKKNKQASDLEIEVIDEGIGDECEDFIENVSLMCCINNPKVKH